MASVDSLQVCMNVMLGVKWPSNRACTSAFRKRWILTKVKSLKSLEDLKILKTSLSLISIFFCTLQHRPDWMASVDRHGQGLGRTWGGVAEEGVWSRRAWRRRAK